MKKLLAVLTISGIALVAGANVAHADEDTGGPPVNPTITNVVTNGSGPCSADTTPGVGGNECGGVAPVNPTITTVTVTHQPNCSVGDAECNAPPTTASTGAGEDAAPAAVVDTKAPVAPARPVVKSHVTTTHTHTHTAAQYGEAILSLMVPGLFLH